MIDTTHETPERIVPSCVEALESYHQADMDGIMVLASRQAIHETIDAYWARVETCEELEAEVRAVKKSLTVAEAKLAKAVEALKMADQAIMENTTDQDLLMWGEPTVSHMRTTLALLKGQDNE